MHSKAMQAEWFTNFTAVLHGMRFRMLIAWQQFVSSVLHYIVECDLNAMEFCDVRLTAQSHWRQLFLFSPMAVHFEHHQRKVRQFFSAPSVCLCAMVPIYSFMPISFYLFTRNT